MWGFMFSCKTELRGAESAPGVRVSPYDKCESKTGTGVTLVLSAFRL